MPDTMKVRYVGPHDEVVVVPLDHPGEWTTKRNYQLEVPTQVGKKLLEQVDMWQAVEESKGGDSNG